MKAAVLITWYGPFPPWVLGFLTSCSRVSRVDWIILHDAPPPRIRPVNVRYVHCPWESFRKRLWDRCGVETPHQPNYKLCDAKVFTAVAFEELFAGYDYFGWGDLDIIVGDLDRFLQPLFGRNSIISFHQKMLSNHLVFFQNTPELRQLYKKIPDYEGAMRDPEYAELDDVQLTALAKEEPSAYFEEFYTTPHVNWIPWCDGTYNFPLTWFWNEGRLTNDLDAGYEFPYFHFMVLKGGEKFYYAKIKNWSGLPPEAFALEKTCPAFLISGAGFEPLRGRKRRPKKQIVLEGKPSYSILRRLRIKQQRLFGAR